MHEEALIKSRVSSPWLRTPSVLKPGAASTSKRFKHDCRWGVLFLAHRWTLLYQASSGRIWFYKVFYIEVACVTHKSYHYTILYDYFTIIAVYMGRLRLEIIHFWGFKKDL